MNKIHKWIKNGRDLALVQSLMPAVVAVIFAAGKPGFRLLPAILAVVGVACAHLASNIMDDYFDYKVDMTGDRDKVIRKGFRAMTVKYPYLTDGSETLATTWKAIVNFALCACACGVVIFGIRTVHSGFLTPDGSWWIIAIVLLTAVLAYFYSAPPLKIAYHGLGELEIGLIFGPLLMIGVYYASCGEVDPGVVFISIPVGILVLNILYTHSFIDMAGDEECGKMTLARLIGNRKACLAAAFTINALPFVIVVTAVCTGALHPLYLLTLLAGARSLWLCRSLLKFYRGDAEVPQTPPKWLGPLIKEWPEAYKAGIGWFLLRWLTARNVLSAFCLLVIIAKLLTLIF